MIEKALVTAIEPCAEGPTIILLGITWARHRRSYVNVCISGHGPTAEKYYLVSVPQMGGWVEERESREGFRNGRKILVRTLNQFKLAGVRVFPVELDILIPCIVSKYYNRISSPA